MKKKTNSIKEKNRYTLTVKASRAYLYLACGFLIFPLFAMLIAFLPKQFAGDPILDRIALVALASLPSIYLALVYRNKRVEVNDTGITVHTILGLERHYSWDGITASKTKSYYPAGTFYGGCVIRKNGKKVVEIPVAFDRYFQLTYQLKRRGLLQEDSE
ncbi:MAG: hypothetical protein J6H21_00420 [Firmicutes bacterium]|nr:hypothetical protein [Bacillota bacterium]